MFTHVTVTTPPNAVGPAGVNERIAFPFAGDTMIGAPSSGVASQFVGTGVIVVVVVVVVL